VQSGLSNKTTASSNRHKWNGIQSRRSSALYYQQCITETATSLKSVNKHIWHAL